MSAHEAIYDYAVIDASKEERSTFIKRTYTHLAAAVLMFTAIEAMLASPDFVFRMEQAPSGIQVGENYAIADIDLAARMSFFIWGLPPDAELRRLAAAGDLSDSDELDRQVARMLSDPRSEALATRFAAQWLRLDDLDKVHPDRLLFPDFHQRLAADLRRETKNKTCMRVLDRVAQSSNY